MVDKISVIGLGYLGIALSSLFASKGYKTYGYDTDFNKIKALASGKLPIYEEGLREIYESSLRSGLLKVTSDPIETISNSDIVFITVGTPVNEDFTINYDQLISSLETIGNALRRSNKWCLIVNKSTVLPGTMSNLIRPRLEEHSGKKALIDFGLASNPEFVSEGSIIKDFLRPHRIVIGTYDERSLSVLEEFYVEFYEGRLPPIIRTTPECAELIKYASNAFLSLKISYVNLIARACEKIGNCDVSIVAKGMGLDPRIGELYLRAGIGFGGSCLPKDLKAFIKYLSDIGVNSSFLREALRINEEQPTHAAKLIEEKIGGFSGKVVCVLGLSFKGGTDDVRESPSIKLINEIIKRGGLVKVYDPVAIKNAIEVLGNSVMYFNDPYEAAKGADIVIIATEWPQFKELNFRAIREVMRGDILFDAKRILSKDIVKDSGLRYFGIGLSEVS
ncbi:MAG: UDP-glucose/GDP-mannose dehydrogenase family protein [Candidatus Geothermarchaeota archaeon]